MLAAGAASPPAPAVAAAPVLPQAASCSGVWVVVDFGSLGGGISARCATSHSTGTAALRNAGFSPTITDGFVYKINGKPGKPDIYKAYWSYWHATRKADGSYNSWTYSNLGANSYKPTAGNAEGWRYQSLSDGKVPPGAAPPSSETPKPTPKPTKSNTPKPQPTKKPSAKPSKAPSNKPSNKPSVKPSSKPTVKPSSKPSASSKPGASSKATTPTASRRPTPTASGRPRSTTSSTGSPSATSPGSTAGSPSTPATASGEASGGVVAAPVSAEAPSAAPTEDPDNGSPVGLIATLGIVVAGVAGLGGWWWKGRNS